MRRFDVRNLAQFKKLARALQRTLDLGHCHCLEQLAQAHGYSGYQELRAAREQDAVHTQSAEPYPEDVAVWKAQLGYAFRTDIDMPIEAWLARVCAPSSHDDSDRIEQRGWKRIP